MDEINGSPYSGFLEQAVRFVYENKPVSITMVAEQASGEVLTAYYHSDANNKMTAIMGMLENGTFRASGSHTTSQANNPDADY